jgi:molybdate transport system substrate-binding protein
VCNNGGAANKEDTMAMKTRAMSAALLCAASIFVLAGMAHAAEVKVLASTGVRDVVVALTPDYERTTGNKVVGAWAGTVDVLKRLQAGEVVDLVILAGPDIDNLIKQGKIVAGSRVPLLKSDVGVCVRSGAPKPDISTPDAVKRTLLAAKSISYSTGPSGVYLLGLFQRMGIADEMKAKATVAPPGVAVGDLVARGEVELGLHQISELLPVAGIDFLGPLPAAIQGTTVFTGGIHAGATQPDAAGALIKFIASPEAVPVIKKKGMEPASP